MLLRKLWVNSFDRQPGWGKFHSIHVVTDSKRMNPSSFHTKDFSSPLTDQQLFEVCEGRTAHKGARSAMDGKLKRAAAIGMGLPHATLVDSQVVEEFEGKVEIATNLIDPCSLEHRHAAEGISAKDRKKQTRRQEKEQRRIKKEERRSRKEEKRISKEKKTISKEKKTISKEEKRIKKREKRQRDEEPVNSVNEHHKREKKRKNEGIN